MAPKRQRINVQHKREKMIQWITELQELASLASKEDIRNELEILKNRVETSKLDTKHYRDYLEPERATCIALSRELEALLYRGVKRGTFTFFLSTLPATLMYTGMYFSLIPKKYLETNVPLYLTAYTIIFSAWIIWFLFTTAVYRNIHHNFIFPYTEKHPNITRQIRDTVGIIRTVVTLNPLLEAAYFAGKTITPNWGNLWTLLIGVGSGNLITAIANSISILSLLFAILITLYRRTRKR